MSEELTPLEALENIKSLFVGSTINLSQQLNIIETALKRLEKIEGITCKEPKDADEILDFLLIRNKALEIIKKRFTIQFTKSEFLPNYYGIMQIGTNPIYIKTKEEFDLLKEVLL